MRNRSASSARATRIGRKEQLPDSKIDYSDIPPLTREQLAGMRRVGRPPLGDGPREPIAIRIDPSVLAGLRKEAKRRNVGYQSLINDVLAEYVRRAG